jgi:hypothetical protein
MKYELVDLGPPQGPVYSTAYLHTPKGNFMVKGNHFILTNHLASDDFPPFFGKILVHRYKRSGSLCNLISKGVKLDIRREGKRSYYFFEGEGGILFKRTRRLPNKWLDCIVNVKFHLLVSADYLEEKGFVIGAEFIRNKVDKWPQVSKINLTLDRPFRRS